MTRLLLRHRRHEGAHIEGKGQIIDVIVRKLYSHKAILEINGVPGIQKVHLNLGQPECKLFPDLGVELIQILGRNKVEIAYLADPNYSINRNDYYDQILAHLVLDFPLNTGARIMGDGTSLDLVVREVKGTVFHREGKVEVIDESGSHYLTLISGEESQPIRDGIEVRLSDKQNSKDSLKIVYHIPRKYGLRRRAYALNSDQAS